MNINAFDGKEEKPIEVDERSLIVDRVTTIFAILHKRKMNKAKFSCGEEICLADYCIASIYFKVLKQEPSLIPVCLDEYEGLKPYFTTLKECLQK